MGQQFEAMVRDLARSVDQTARSVEIYYKRIEELGREHRDMGERLMAIETGSKIELEHGEKEHDRLLERLKEGDEEFKILRQKADAAVNRAESAVRKIEELQKALNEEETSRKKKGSKLAKVALEALPGVVTAAALWLIQHLYFLAKLAEAAKMKGGHP